MKHLAVAAVLLAASTGLAAAHDTAPIELEMQRQAQAIEDGRRNGDLTWMEARQLNDEQSRIGWMLTQARYDGTVTAREVHAICDAQETAKENIATEVADSDVSRWRRWTSGRDDRGHGDGYGAGYGHDRWGWGDRGGWGQRWGLGFGRGDRDRN